MNPFKNKKGLGRGLSSLIGDVKATSVNNKLSLSDIIRNRFQPRKNFDKMHLEELSNSIKERGVVQPIIVRKSQKSSGKYEIIAGERRWLASQNAGLHEIPAVIIEADDLKSLEFAIVENVQRHDLNSIEEAQGYQRLMDEFGYDQEKVAKFIGKSRAHVANCIRLLSLPDDVIKLIETDQLSQGHAKILVGLENAYLFAKKIIQKKLSVRQSENLVRLFKNPKKSKIINNFSNLRDLEDILEKKLGIRVLIKNKKNNSGSIVFDYRDLDQLNRLIEIIKSNY
jgi:ParB family chromosome partitioning protein